MRTRRIAAIVTQHTYLLMESSMIRRFSFLAALAAGLCCWPASTAPTRTRTKTRQGRRERPLRRADRQTGPRLRRRLRHQRQADQDFGAQGQSRAARLLGGLVRAVHRRLPASARAERQIPRQGFGGRRRNRYEERFGFDKDKGELTELEGDKKLTAIGGAEHAQGLRGPLQTGLPRYDGAEDRRKRSS